MYERPNDQLPLLVLGSRWTAGRALSQSRCSEPLAGGEEVFGFQRQELLIGGVLD